MFDATTVDESLTKMDIEYLYMTPDGASMILLPSKNKLIIFIKIVKSYNLIIHILFSPLPYLRHVSSFEKQKFDKNGYRVSLYDTRRSIYDFTTF